MSAEALDNKTDDIESETSLPDGGLRVLSLSCVYPNARDSNLGLFVWSRLRHLSDWAEVKVIAPIPQIDYSRSRVGRGAIPKKEWDGPIETFRPAWIYPPGGYAANPIFLFLRLLPLVAGLRNRYGFHVIDAHFAFPDGIAASVLSRALGVPFTVTLRGNETMHACYPWRRRLMAWSLKKASAIFTLSEELKRFAISLGVDEARVRVVPNGIDTETFYERDRSQCRQKHSIRQDRKLILSAGALIERKGHHRVMQALASLLREKLKVELIIAGGRGREGQYENEIRKQVIELGLQANVRIVGEVSPGELAEFMCAADVFCLASSREGWPNVIHEAMACGVPVVATRVGAIEDMIPSADYGLIVPSGDSAALARALQDALGKKWNGTAIATRAHSRTWTQVAKEVFEILRKETAAGRAPGGI